MASQYVNRVDRLIQCAAMGSQSEMTFYLLALKDYVFSFLGVEDINFSFSIIFVGNIGYFVRFRVPWLFVANAESLIFPVQNNGEFILPRATSLCCDVSFSFDFTCTSQQQQGARLHLQQQTRDSLNLCAKKIK